MVGCTKKRYRHSIPSLMLPVCILGRNVAVHLGSQMHRLMIVAPGAGIKRTRSGSHDGSLISIDDGESIKKVENNKSKFNLRDVSVMFVHSLSISTTTL